MKTETCKGVKKSGEPCQSTALGADGYCGPHSPSISETVKAEWVKSGGETSAHKAKMALALAATEALTVSPLTIAALTPDLSSALAIREYLAELVAQVRAGKIPTSVGKTVRDLLETALRLQELELEWSLLAKVESPEMLALLLEAKASKGKLAHELADTHGA